ncbi:gamma-glutamylcyclotransferase [Devosia sp.]|uniref:gamma-glutamylcyclotransferase n=1 Tax=Devosia sp. TaxID=1871048 RepID=UPI003A92BF79
MARRLHLTADHVARVPVIGDPGPANYAGTRPATDADYDAAVDHLMAGAPDGEFWIFAYGSLIWNPATEFDDQRIAVARGWHRNFCLHDERYRGNPAQPGLMLCLDRGGACRGVAYRLPQDRIRENMDKLIRREMSVIPNAFPGRWVTVATETGPLKALTFVIDRRNARYVGGLSLDQRADRLAIASGWRGSMAEYVFATISKLEDLGIHDRNLWSLQKLIAARIDSATHTRNA